MYIPTRIKRELVRFGGNCDWRIQIPRSVHGGSMTFHSSGQTIFSLEGTTQAASEEIYEVSGKTSLVGSKTKRGLTSFS